MISFEICVNGKPVTKFSAVRVRTEVIDDVEMGVYGWTSWKPGPDAGPDIGSLEEYTTSEVCHDPSDRVEELAANILEDWVALRIKRAFEASPAASYPRQGAISDRHS